MYVHRRDSPRRLGVSRPRAECPPGSERAMLRGPMCPRLVQPPHWCQPHWARLALAGQRAACCFKLARGRPSARIRPLPAFQQRAGAASWAMALQSSMRVPRNFEAWAMLVDSQAIIMMMGVCRSGRCARAAGGGRHARAPPWRRGRSGQAGGRTATRTVAAARRAQAAVERPGTNPPGTTRSTE